jgi:hypothetical protein
VGGNQNPSGAFRAWANCAHAATTKAPPPPATVPDVVGLDLGAATAQVTTAGLTNMSTSYGCYAAASKGVVVSQSPSGFAVDPSTQINLQLEGFDCQIVPDLIGLDLTQVRATLDPLGLHLALPVLRLAEHRCRHLAEPTSRHGSVDPISNGQRLPAGQQLQHAKSISA